MIEPCAILTVNACFRLSLQVQVVLHVTLKRNHEQFPYNDLTLACTYLMHARSKGFIHVANALVYIALQ